MPILENPKFEVFALAYVRTKNKTKAALEAGYSEKTAKQLGYRISRYPDVAARIAELLKVQFQAMQMENDEILGRIAAQARSNIRTVFDDDGRVRPIQELSEDEAFAIQELTETVTPGGKDAAGNKLPDIVTRKIKMRDPTQALRMLAQHKKLIGSEGDEALGNIAEAFAARMAKARAARGAAK